MVRTDHIILFIGRGVPRSKPSDLIPELQGRFPIRVELEALGKDEFVRILTEPRSALIKQVRALHGDRRRASRVHRAGNRRSPNWRRWSTRRTENIGARRLHTVLESFSTSVLSRARTGGQSITIDAPVRGPHAR
jgi:ATP-dependent HslUV protease ATP-binding subunit HslU